MEARSTSPDIPLATREVLKLPVGPMSSIKLSAEERGAVASYVAGLK